MKVQTFIDRPILSCVLSAFIVILGVIGLTRLPLEQFPEIAPPTVRITATYQGADAETLMNSVISPIEETVNGVEGINYITSSTNNSGQATVTVFFRQGTDPDMAAVNVQNRLSQAQGLLPAEVIRSGISVRKSQNSTAKIIALYSPDNRFDQSFIFNYFKINIEPQLARIRGVGDITLFGSEYSLRIWLKPDKMASYNLIPADIEKALSEQNIEAPIGIVGADTDNTFQYSLKYRGRFQSEEEFKDIIIRSDDEGRLLKLGDVADIQLGQLSYSVKNEISGHPATNCMISQLPGSNANEVVSEIDDVITRCSSRLPEGLALVDLMSVKSFMDASVHNVVKTLLEAVILVAVIVFVFLQSFRAAIIPILSIVVSLVGTLAFLYFAGFSLNMLTLFALVLVIGTVVDDAVVVVEAVQSHLDDAKDLSSKAATVAAMAMVTRPLVTTSLVFMAVFIPVCFIDGTAGIFYRQFGMTMAVAVLISTVNALTLSPALSALLMRPTDKPDRFGRVFQLAFKVMTAKYSDSLNTLRQRPLVTILTVTASIGLVALLFVNTKTGFVPNEDTGTIVVDVQTTPGTSKARTNEVMSQIEGRINDIPQIQIYSKSVGTGMLGGQGASNGTFIIRLKPWNERQGYHNSNMAVIEEIYSRLADITDARIISFAQPIIAGYGVTNGFEVHLQDRSGKTITELESVTHMFIDKLNASSEIGRAQTSFNAGYPQYKVEVDAAKCKRDGVDPEQLLQTLGAYIGGNYVSNINRFSKLYRVILQAPADGRVSTSDLSSLYIRNASGNMAPASNYVNLEKVYGPESITRFNLFTSIAINGSPAPGYSSGQAIDAIRRVAMELPDGYDIEFGGMTREEVSTSGNSMWVFIICAIFIYLILASLYENLIIPIVIILAVPVGILGSFSMAMLFGIDNNIYMQTGTIMLIGLLAKTAILLTEYATELWHSGYELNDAVTIAAKQRIRPIIMTSLTMIFGLLPMAFAEGVGSNGEKSLAICLIGGMLLGTLSILYLVPSLFVIFNSRRIDRH